MRRWALRTAALAVICLAAAYPDALLAGTTGTVAGTVTDQEGRPVVAATILVIGTRLGAYADAEGSFNILNVPPGTYEVRASRLGFNPVTISGVIVSSDQTVRIEFKMGDTTLQAEEVVVVAARPPVDLKETSSQSTLTTEEIESLPVQNLEDVVNLQAGVVDGHFRGGRQGEVQYQVDGVSVNNAFDNSSSLKIDRSLLQEVQVISGTFDAEYGQAMSGVVNAVLKNGTEDFLAEGEFYSGGFFFPGREDQRLADDTPRLAGTQSYQLTLSGPLPLAKTTYLVSGRRYLFDDYIYAERRYNPTDDVEDPTEPGSPFVATGDGEEMPLGYNDEWSGVVKFSNSSFANTSLNYQAVFNGRKGRPQNYMFRYMPDGLSIQRSVSISHGFDVTHTLGASSFLDSNLRQNYFEYTDYLYEDIYDPRYDEVPQLDSSTNLGDWFYQGVQLNHYRQKTNAFILKGALVSQLDQVHQLKTGVELSLPAVTFGNDVTFTYGEGTLVRHLNEPPDYPGPATYHPVMGAAFIQDQAETADLIVRFGARLDYFDARSTIPSDLANPANAIAGAPESRPQDTTVKASVSPRLGVAYPIEDKAAIHFAYGHFRQFPSVGTMFTNSDYDILARLQAGEVRYGLMGNPDVKPEETVQYEAGYKQVLTPDLGFDLTIYYKDIRELLGVEFIETYTGAEYTRLTNVDFGNTLGVTLAVDHRKVGPLSLALDYTWQQALGNSSDPSETANRAAAGEDPRPRLVPFNWDQRHTVNLTAALNKPGKYSVSTVVRLASGQPYTPVTEAAFGFNSETNSGRKPTGFLVDLRAEKTIGSGGNGGVFLRVFNLFDARFFNGPVFATTGSPYYSRTVSPSEEIALRNPTRFYPPRRLEFGVRWKLGGS
ncbi:TonB-dependent receptor [bacterium]|nr:TonB-dependent receptor [bacterium]